MEPWSLFDLGGLKQYSAQTLYEAVALVRALDAIMKAALA